MENTDIRIYELEEYLPIYKIADEHEKAFFGGYGTGSVVEHNRRKVDAIGKKIQKHC